MVIPYHERFIEPYLEALLLELKRATLFFQKHLLVSVYLGGGTPSLLPLYGLEKIISLLHPYLTKDTEITLEANPESVSKEKVVAWKKMGINRFSLGVQSFQEQDLIELTRTHGSQQIFQAIEAIVSECKNISIDLLYDLFDQTVESLTKNLELANSLPLTHLSLYNLVIEPHTSFYKQKKMALQPNEEISLQLHNLAMQMLEDKGFSRYEISAFAKEGYLSHHNLGYWQARDFLGFGPSAWSYFDQKRTRKTQVFQRWIKEVKRGENACDFEEKLDEPFASYEKLAIGLRVLDGMQLSLIQQNHPELPLLENEGYIERNNTWVRLTKKGTLFYDSIAQRIV